MGRKRKSKQTKTKQSNNKNKLFLGIYSKLCNNQVDSIIPPHNVIKSAFLPTLLFRYKRMSKDGNEILN